MSAEADEAEAGAMIEQVRRDGRQHMRRMIASAFEAEGATIAQAIADELDYFGVAGFDGAFIACQAEPALRLPDQLERLAEAMAALGEGIAARRVADAGQPGVVVDARPAATAFHGRPVRRDARVPQESR